MKSFIQAIALVAIFAAPAASFAQSGEPVSRADVHAQLVQLENAGYIPGSTDAYAYPENIRAAEAIVAAKNRAAQNTAYGSSTDDASQSGKTVKN